jgi:hypothetical protein
VFVQSGETYLGGEVTVINADLGIGSGIFTARSASIGMVGTAGSGRFTATGNTQTTVGAAGAAALSVIGADYRLSWALALIGLIACAACLPRQTSKEPLGRWVALLAALVLAVSIPCS